MRKTRDWEISYWKRMSRSKNTQRAGTQKSDRKPYSKTKES